MESSVVVWRKEAKGNMDRDAADSQMSAVLQLIGREPTNSLAWRLTRKANEGRTIYVCLSIIVLTDRHYSEYNLQTWCEL